jgi:hypothetical protein
MNALRSRAPERYEEILLRLRRYDERLQRFGLADRHLDWQVSDKEAVRFALRELLFATLLLPLCAVGVVAFYVPYKLTGLTARWSTRERDVLATAQVIAGSVIYSAWLALIVAAAWRVRGSWAAVGALLLVPLVAVCALFAIERENAVMEAVRGWFLLRRAREETRDRLRRRRSELADILDEVSEWLNTQPVRDSVKG